MSELPNVTTVAYQKLPPTLPAEVKSTEPLELASNQHEEEQIELITSNSEINSDEETMADEGFLSMFW